MTPLSTSDPARWLDGRRGIVLLVVLAVVAYWATLLNGFVYDDDLAIRTSPLVTQGLLGDAWSQDFWGTTGPVTTGTYRPLVVTTFILQWFLAPGNPLPFRLVHLAVIAGVAALALIFFRRFLSLPWAWAAAAFFIVHPANHEVANSLVQRSELTATAAVLGYLILLWPDAAGRVSRSRRLAAVLIFLAGLFSKENALAAPVLLVLLDRFRPGGATRWRETLRRHGLSLALAALAAAVYFLMRTNALHELARGVPFQYNPTIALSEFWRHVNSGWLAFRYVLRFAWPFPQPVEWTYNELPVFGPEQWRVWGPVWIGLLALAGATLVGLARRRIAAIGVAWFAVAIFPVVQAFVTPTVLFADRCLFLPSVGLALAVAAGAQKLAERGREKPIVPALAGLLIVGFAVYQASAAPRWRDNLTLFENLTENSPNCANVREGYGKFLYEAGELDPAHFHLFVSTTIFPEKSASRHWLGKVQFAGGYDKLATLYWETARRLSHPLDLPPLVEEQARLLKSRAWELLVRNPGMTIRLMDSVLAFASDDMDAWRGKALAWALLGKRALAEQMLAEMAAKFPGDSRVILTSGSVAELLGDTGKAVDIFKKAVQQESDPRGARRLLVFALAAAGRTDEAIRELMLLLHEDPNDPVLRIELARLRGAATL
ncbi:MAG: hypothetical protein C4523_02865 [Myxococcales bacterium]|nr:MAG: hypothetical protein C4523_02865 [Myxococcales bacterium]